MIKHQLHPDMPTKSIDNHARTHSSSSAPSAPVSSRPTAAVIDLGAIEHNFREATRRAEGRQGPGGRQGAGLRTRRGPRFPASPGARGRTCSAWRWLKKGKELRDAGIEAPILLMGPMFPEQAEAAAKLNLTPAVYSMPVARALVGSRAETRAEDFRPREDRYRHGKDRRHPRGGARIHLGAARTFRHRGDGADDPFRRRGPARQEVRIGADGPLRGAAPGTGCEGHRPPAPSRRQQRGGPRLPARAVHHGEAGTDAVRVQPARTARRRARTSGRRCRS